MSPGKIISQLKELYTEATYNLETCNTDAEQELYTRDAAALNEAICTFERMEETKMKDKKPDETAVAVPEACELDTMFPDEAAPAKSALSTHDIMFCLDAMGYKAIAIESSLGEESATLHIQYQRRVE